MSNQIRQLTAADSRAMEEFLLPRLQVSMFLIGNARKSGMEFTGEPYSGVYMAVFDKAGKIQGVAAHFWNNMFIVSSPVATDELFFKTLAHSLRPVQGIIGPASQINAIRSAWCPKEESIKLDQTEKLYHLSLDDLVEPKLLKQGFQCRHAIKADLDLMIRWRVDYSKEALGDSDSEELQVVARMTVERAMAEGHLWVLEKQGEVVSTTAFNTAIREAVQVGGVWTPVALRSRGYARAAVGASLLEARQRGVQQSILFTGRENIAAQRSYEALGFTHIGDYGLFLFKHSQEVKN